MVGSISARKEASNRQLLMFVLEMFLNTFPFSISSFLPNKFLRNSSEKVLSLI